MAHARAAKYTHGVTATEQEAHDIGKDVYVYAYALMLQLRTMQLNTNFVRATGVLGQAPYNVLSHALEFPDGRSVVRPNVDTLPSVAYLDLDAQPVVLSIPATDRYFTMMLVSAWTEVFASPGTRTTGRNVARDFLIAGPRWRGVPPIGVEILRCPTRYATIAGRTQTNGIVDYASAHAIQAQYKLVPLSAWNTTAYTPPPNYVDARIDMKTPPAVQLANMDAATFLAAFSEAIKDNPPGPQDYPIVHRLEQLGFIVGQRYDLRAVPESIAHAIEAGTVNGKGLVESLAKRAAGHGVTGWAYSTTIGAYGVNYRERAAVARHALGANLAEDAIAASLATDAEGNPLDGTRPYVLRFAAGRLPPVNAFWSVTAYNAEGFVTPNSLDRFALGDRDPLVRNADGSLDLYIQAESPGNGKEANWLPVGPQPFTLLLRLYAPRPEVLDGTWKPPAIIAAAAARRAPTAPPDTRHVSERAVEAINWGIRAVNYDQMYQALVRARGAYNQIVYWSRLPDWKLQTLTPNMDTIYFSPFFSTRDVGPIVLEIPSAQGGSITGTIMDCWQNALEDVGPAGVDKGKGGKYLILPPRYTLPVPEGYIVLPSDTYRGYALLRSNLASTDEGGVAAAVAYGKRIKLYPLAQAGEQPVTPLVDAADRIFDATIPFDARFFESLDRTIQTEPWLERDKVMIDLLASIGIEKGKRFQPNASTRKLLDLAAADAHEWLETRYEASITPYYEGAQWGLPGQPALVKTQATFFESADAYAVDATAVLYTMAYSSVKHLGAGQFYLLTLLDKRRSPLDGSTTYRLSVPASVPASLYWSATVYDRATHAPIRELTRASRASHSRGLVTNPDGSVDVYFGPRPPDGQEANWVPTRPDARFEVLFRFYGPERSLFDKSWRLPDIEPI